MDMQHVQYLLSVSETLNFTRAAERCGVSQPTLTRAVKAIEAELGGELLRREGRRTHVTELGERMLPFLRKSYENARLAKDLASAVMRQEVLRMSLAVSHCVNLELFMGAAADLYRQFPGLQLRISHGSRSVVAEALKEGRADIALSGDLGDGWDRYEQARLFDEPYALFVAEGHPLALRDDIAASDLRDFPIFVNTSCERDASVSDWLREHVPNFRGANEFDRSEPIGAYAADVDGVVIAPVSARVSSGYRRRACRELNVMRSVSAFSVAGRPRSASATAFLNQVRAMPYALEAAAA